MGVVLKRAVYFITCEGRQMYPLRMDEDFILHNLLSSERNERGTAGVSYRQLSLFDDQAFSPEEAGYSCIPAEFGIRYSVEADMDGSSSRYQWDRYR